MWLLSLPLPAERRLALPQGRHYFPWHYDATEIARLAEFLAGILKDVERHWILPWPAARAVFTSENPPNLQDTLIVVTFPGDAIDTEKLEEVLALPACRHIMLHFPEPRELGYAWQEKYLKRELIDLIQEEISLESHPLAAMNVASLPVRLAATLTTDVLGLVDLLERTLLHRLEHIAEGTSAENYKNSLLQVAGERFTERLLRLLPEERDAAIEVLKKEGAGVWQDEQFRLAAKALQEAGLGRFGEGSISLGPLARRAKEEWLLPILHQLSKRPKGRRWVAETAMVVEEAPEEYADFARATLSTLTTLTTAFRTAPQKSSAPRNELERVRSWIRGGSTFEERCERARDFLTDPERSRFVRTNESDDYSLWFEPIRAEFTDEEWKRTNRPSLPPQEFIFRTLDSRRFAARITEARFDFFLSKHLESKLDFARWIAFALFEETFVNNKELFANLLSWLWRTILQENVNSDQQEGLGIVRRCLALARKNNYDQETFIEEDAISLGIDIGSVLPAGEHASEFVLTMKMAFEKMLDGAFKEAQEGYSKAVSLAKYAGNTFGEWVALHGERDAAWENLPSRQRMSASGQNERDSFQQRIDDCARSSAVAKWIEKARTLGTRIDKTIITELRQNKNDDAINVEGGVIHEYFTMFRDLETIYAPPALQREYVHPLIDVGGFELHEQFRYRMQLLLDKWNDTTLWLRQITTSPMTLENAQLRDQFLIAEFLRSNTFKLERLQRLQTLPVALELFTLEKLAWVPEFLSTCQNDLNQGAWPSGMRENTYARALCAYASIDLRLEAIDFFLAFDLDSASWDELQTLASQLDRGEVPFEQWIGLYKDQSERLVKYILELKRLFDTDDVDGTIAHSLLWVLLNVFQSIKKVGAEISPAVTEETRQWAQDLIGRDTEGAVHLAYLLAPDDQSRNEVQARALDTVKSVPLSDNLLFYYHVPFNSWLELTDANEDVESLPVLSAARTLWQNLEKLGEVVPEATREVIEKDSVHVAFLSRWLASGNSSDPAAVRRYLLHVLAISPEDLQFCSEIVELHHWQNDWPAFVFLLRKQAIGDHEDSMKARIGALDLLKSWADDRSAPERLHDDLGFLVDAALWAIGEENHDLAKHGAYAIAAYAIHAHSPEDISRVGYGLRRIAIDGRVEVRGAAAYAGKRLPLVAGIHDEILAVAKEIDEQLASDTYAIIHRQRIFGELDGKYPPK